MIQVIFNEDTSQKGSFCKKEQNLSKNTVQILKSPLCNFSQERFVPLSHYRMPVLQKFRPFTLSHLQLQGNPSKHFKSVTVFCLWDAKESRERNLGQTHYDKKNNQNS